MLRFALFAAFLALALAAPSPFNQKYEAHWQNFKRFHAKNYGAAEEGLRRLIFEQNVEKIINHNLEADLGLHTYTLGLNKYADLTKREFILTLTGLRHRANYTSKAQGIYNPAQNLALPDEVDWRDKNIVTPVKDQGQCGSCWAFSTTGSIEGQWALKNSLVSLSEQNLVDCSGPEGNSGCEGGLMDEAFDYVKKNGIDTEECYPYTAQDDKCVFDKKCVGATISSYVDVQQGSESALQKAVANIGPISVAIDAGHDSFQLYSGGIYNEPDCSTSLLDHGVLAVGYGSDGGKDFWIVKNSWGDSWGEEGYIKMSRNKQNQCGIATMASYPVV